MVWIISSYHICSHKKLWYEIAVDNTEDDYDDIRILGDGSRDVSWTYNHPKLFASSDCHWRCGMYLDYDDNDDNDDDNEDDGN